MSDEHDPPPAEPAKQPARRRNFLQGPVDAVLRLPAAVRALSAALALILLLLTSLTGLLNTGSELPSSWNRFINTFHPGPKPSDSVVFVSSDQVMAISYLAVLSDNGFGSIDLLDPSQMEQLVDRRPGVVILGDSQAQAQLPVMSDRLRQLLTTGTKVIGMGTLGAALFDQLQPFSPLGMRHAAGVNTTEVRLAANSSASMRANLPIDAPFRVYQADDDTGIAIHDAGSLDILQAHRLAEASIEGSSCGGHYYPVMQQGDFYMWGYTQVATGLTDMGRRLFVDLLSDALKNPLTDTTVSNNFYEPGTYTGTLGCGYSINSYVLRLTGAGQVNVHVTSHQSLELTLSTAGTNGVTPRVEAVSPHLTGRAAQQSGGVWLVTVAYRSAAAPTTRVSYDVDLQYPAQPARRFPLGVLTIVFIVALDTSRTTSSW